jgi:type IV pilus assembly protein PilY1
MRHHARHHAFTRYLGYATACAGATLACSASAQTAKTLAAPPIPNVLLLIDNSGSMENMIDGTTPEANTFSGSDRCTLSPGVTTGALLPSTPNRWGTLLQAMTGTFAQGYYCYAETRNGAASTPFPREYQINGVAPYDFGYALPYHRPVAQTTSGDYCSWGPYALPDGNGGSLSGVGDATFGNLMSSAAGHAPLDFPSDALALFEVRNLDVPTGKASSAGYPVSTTGTCQAFEQASDGALDAARDLIRFGLMTFDNDTDSGVGVSATAGVTPLLHYDSSLGSPFLGMWSYFPHWDNATGWAQGGAGPGYGAASGKPFNCAVPRPFEVGARNAAAPLWEGRHVRFPDGAAPIVTQQANNEWLQRVLLATRPYGATPIEGMLDDARHYFFNDPFGPYQSDPYSSEANSGAVGCRDQYVILITDGVPNLDLRPSCEQPGSGATPSNGQCPYAKDALGNYDTNIPPRRAADIVRDLASGGFVSGMATPRPRVKTYVIGFAVSTTAIGDPAGGGGQFASCQALFSAIGNVGPTPWTTPPTMPTICNSPTAGGQNDPSTLAGQKVQACCTLQELAVNGATNNGAFFVDSPTDFGKALAMILGEIAATSTSRAVPVASPTLNLGSNTFAVSSSFASTFDPVRPGLSQAARKQNITASDWPWSGDVVRTRKICSGSPAVPQVAGTQVINDDFRVNVDSHGASTNRRFFTVFDASSTGIDQSQTMRPFVTSDVDGAGLRTSGEVGPDYAAIKTKMLTNALDYLRVGVSSCPQMVDLLGNKYPRLSQADCASVSLAFAMGQNESPASFNFANFGRYAGNTYDYSAMGAILHSSPTIAPPPADAAREDSYREFVTINSTRPPVLYVQTLDGLLHAFDVTNEDPAGTMPPPISQTTGTTAPGPTTAVNNELWAFIPPATLPLLRSNFPGGQQNLLDGSPAVRDVVFTRSSAQTGDVKKWHTVLVAGFGQSLGGYYALDVTDPVMRPSWAPEGTTLPQTPDTYVAPRSAPTPANGPHFLWQMAGAPLAIGDVQLFGKHSATPAIGTITVNVSGTGLREVGVAILPGGISDGPFAGTCPRAGSTTASTTTALPADSTWNARGEVRNWAGNACTLGVPGRSVTIVRMEDGAILRTFGRTADVPNGIRSKGVFTATPLDSPMTGVPVTYPPQVGAAMKEFFVGDADGTIWRFDVSNPDPSQWTGKMFLDTFNPAVMASVPTPATPGVSKPTSTADFANVSQPIALAPVLSLDPAGNLVMLVATGDQDTFTSTSFAPGSTTQKIAAYNFVYAITEKFDTTQSPEQLRATVDWYRTFVDGERVTGPMAVFDKASYFATYAPLVGANVCANGESRIWGVDFITPGTGCGGVLNIACTKPVGIDPLNPTNNYIVPGNADPSVKGQLIPGVVVTMQPPCSTVTTVTDQFAGGSYTAFSMSSSAAPMLSYLTNRLDMSRTQTTATTKTITLPPPKFATVVDSWAAVVE